MRTSIRSTLIWHLDQSFIIKIERVTEFFLEPQVVPQSHIITSIIRPSSWCLFHTSCKTNEQRCRQHTEMRLLKIFLKRIVYITCIKIFKSNSLWITWLKNFKLLDSESLQMTAILLLLNLYLFVNDLVWMKLSTGKVHRIYNFKYLCMLLHKVYIHT